MDPYVNDSVIIFSYAKLIMQIKVWTPKRILVYKICFDSFFSTLFYIIFLIWSRQRMFAANLLKVYLKNPR